LGGPAEVLPLRNRLSSSDKVCTSVTAAGRFHPMVLPLVAFGSLQQALKKMKKPGTMLGIQN